MIARPTTAIRGEHHELLACVEGLRQIADRIGALAPDALRRDLGHQLYFLQTRLLPHAAAEERVLYPTVARLLSCPRATETMSRDHVAIRALVEQLAFRVAEIPRYPLARDAENGLRRVLYGLHALLSVHLAKENEIYLPLLDEQLTAEEARELDEKMRKAQEER